MTLGSTYATLPLFLGDVAVFVSSLWLMLFVRYGELPSLDLFEVHIRLFFVLFCVWLLVFYMAGLYGKSAALFKSGVPATILRAQVLNLIIAALFFFLVPDLAIAPKLNLVIYLVISLGLIFAWRLAVFPHVSRPSERMLAALVGAGPDADELEREVNGNARYHIRFESRFAPEDLVRDFDAFARSLPGTGISSLVVDTGSDALRPVLPKIYDLAVASRAYQVYGLHGMYEEVFDRVPLSLLEYDWFLNHLSRESSLFYAAAKRAVDLVGGVLMGVVTVVAAPLVWIALRLEGPGPLFIAQERLGRFGARVRAYKFRSMREHHAASGAWVGEGENRVTKVGRFLRQTSLDEFPQFWNVLKGELSLIGPRNDIEGLALRLSVAIPYYSMRYVVTPGITGWAQINQQYEQDHISPQSIEETKVRLAYDFYYIKNRSFALDIVIALKTIKRMFFRFSSW